MNKILMLVACHFIVVHAYSQYNLVPNYSFEDNVICPNATSGGSVPPPWYLPQNYNNTFIFLHACSTAPFASVPNNSTGFQYAKTGAGYGILDFYLSSFFDGRFYYQTQLNSMLVAGKCYYGEFWVSLCNSSRIAVNNIGMLLTDTAIRVANTYPLGIGLIPASPQVFNYGNPVINDTLKWVKISAVFTAQGGEKYLTIGNFKGDANTQQVQVASGTSNKAGYYIDDIRLIPLDSISLQADAGADRTITAGNSTYIGSYTNGLTNVTWFNSAGATIATGVPGLTVSPASSTFYVVEQNVCGQYSRDTVYVNVGVVPLRITDYRLQIASLRGTKQSVGNIWTTANEVNVSHFNVQRSSDGVNFYTIQQTAAKNNAYNEYSVADLQPLSGTSYYRVEAVDKDGKITYSKVLSIAISDKPLAVSLYPNPAKDFVTISYSQIKQVSILDITGRVLLTKDYQTVDEVKMDIGGLTKGIYLVRVMGGENNISTQKLIIE